MTLAEWVDALNGRIKDGENVLFTVAEKEAHLAAAVEEYSRRRPRVFDVELHTAAGQQCYPLPAGCLWVVQVALPTPASAEGPAAAAECLAGQRGWLEQDGTLWLFPAPSAAGLTFRLTCAGVWSAETVPAADQDLVLTLAHANCCQVLATDAARAFTFWVGDEKFDKSAVSAHYLALAEALRTQARRALTRR
ncbi:MAG: hypothetical protein GX774_06605 [Armatimonadetes bacterium]|nr:hypothetical protein [Armatimonadota bacterium]